MVLNNKQNEEIEPILDESIETQENVEDEEFDDVDLTFPLSIDAEDSRGTTLDDAINDRMHPQNTEWPNDIYREFMEIVMEYQLSNSCGDRIIKLIDKVDALLMKIDYQKVPRKVLNFLILTNFLI